MHCTACGQHNHEGANFCGACGTALATEANASPTQGADAGATVIVASPAVHDGNTQHAPTPTQPVPPQGQIRIVAVGGVLLLIALVAVLAYVVLSGGEGNPPSQDLLDEPLVDVVELDGTVLRLQVDVDFEGSVDNIALYGDGALVDQAASLGGSLVWTDPPEGRHDLILRAQKGDVVLIGAPTTIVIGGEATPDSTTPDDTTPPTTTPGDGDPDDTAVDATSSTTSASTTQPPPSIGPYVAVLASLPKGTVTLDAANQSGQNLAITFGLEFHRVIDSDNWASLRDDFWVIATSRNFETLDRAAAHCWELGATDANTCFGRPITQNPDDLTVVGVPAP